MRFHAEVDSNRAYQEHRDRLKNAKAVIDHHPPELYAGNFCRFSKLKEDVTTFLHNSKCNTRLYISINSIARTRGIVDSFRTTENFIETSYSKESQKFRSLERVENENMRLGKRLLCTKSELDSHIHPKFLRKHKSKKTNESFKYPAEVLSKYNYDGIPKEPNLAKKFLRPKIWFQLEVKGVRPLGRIAMELYTEAAPQVVLEFVRLCSSKEKKRINFMRLFPGLWLEGEITLDKKTLIEERIEFDKRPVDHGRHTGVLSFSLENIKLFKQGFLNFTISFKPLCVLNGNRVGFGHVYKGFKVLNCMQDYGTKNGKPIKQIVVSDCGIYF